MTAPLIKEYSGKLTETRRKELTVGYRDLVVGSPQVFFTNNTVSTTKYTVFTFLPLNLLYQFSKIANLYFLFLTILQIIPEVSISDGIPTILAPLAFIVLLSMVKDAFEDYKRYKSDREENEKQAFVWRTDKFVRIDWKDIRVGDLVKVSKDQFFPCDLIVIASSDFKKGQCFIETKNLDGETNLKSKNIPEDLRSIVLNEDDALKLVGSLVNAEGPNQYLSKFKGTIDFAGKKIPLSSNNFLLRGCILRNVEYVFGIATYTG
jgi:phospholipid-transporting ATPase